MRPNYFTVIGESENLTVVERSKFFCNIKGIENEMEAKEYIELLRKKHSLANHSCYAYIADDKGLIQKFSDAGEPQGTAGLPMLEVLKNKKMYKTVAVVTRYFGGIKLGTGGLTRAYGGAVSECLKVSNVVDMCDATIIKIVVDYEKYSRLIKFLSNPDLVVLSTEYDNEVCVKLVIRSILATDFIDKLVDSFNGKINCNIIGNEYYAFKE